MIHIPQKAWHPGTMISYPKNSHVPCGRGALRKGYISLTLLVGAIVFSRLDASWRSAILWEYAVVSTDQSVAQEPFVNQGPYMGVRCTK